MTAAWPVQGQLRTRAAGAEGAAPRLSISVLGGLSLWLGKAPVALPNRKARGILAYLALEGGAPVRRERLAGLFWSDAPERQARNSLRQTVFELREAMERHQCGALIVGRDTLSLAVADVTLDIEEILAEIGRGNVPPTLAAHPGRAEQLLAAYEDLSPLFGEWLSATRRAVQARLIRALVSGYSDVALSRRIRREMAELVLRLDPLHEEACRTVMRLAAEDGEIGAALRSYAALYESLGAELDMEPSAPTQELVAAIKQGEIGVVRIAAPPTPRPSAPNGRGRPDTVRLAAEGAPVVAMLPFRAIGPEPVPDYVAEGIAEDIVYLLAGLREPIVISANSTRHLRAAEADDVMRCAEQLGADYLVTGSLRLAKGIARIAVELAEASQGAVLWGRSIEIPRTALFEAQAEIAAGIANALVPRLTEAELRATRRRAPEDLGAYHLLLRARDRMYRFLPEPFEEAGSLLERAAVLDPDYAPIHAAMIEWRCYRIFQGWSRDRDADARALENAAANALRLDPCHSRALALYGHNRTIIGHHYDEALDLLDRAVASGPNDAETLIWTCPTLAYVGRAEEAIGRARRAIALSPHDPFMFRYEHFLSIAHYAAGDLEAAAEIGLRSAQRHPSFTSNLRVTIAALAGLNRLAEATPWVERLMSLQPGLRVGNSLPHFAYRDPADRERHARYLRLAGIPG